LRNQPWTHSTGPRTVAGKAQAAANGKKRQLGPWSIRESRRELADVRSLIGDLQQTRRLAEAYDHD
jgi:hypothetical protein